MMYGTLGPDLFQQESIISDAKDTEDALIADSGILDVPGGTGKATLCNDAFQQPLSLIIDNVVGF